MLGTGFQDRLLPRFALYSREAVLPISHPKPSTPRERLIFALDVDDLDEAEQLVRKLAPHVGLFKVGPTLFTGVGPLALDLIQGMGAGVFLDLKFHDIPATVGAAAREVGRQRVKMFTVHALGGRRMIQSAAAELVRMTLIPGVPPPLVLAVTLLTSHTEEELAGLGLSGPLVEHSVRLAKLALEAGAGGVVASAWELPRLREALPPSTIFVTPGIRGAGDPVGDQSRVVTATEAVERGATYIVVGRPIRDASDQVGAAQRIVEEIGEARAP
jgi:orotidine-5'-phosphate decarboxylase